MWSGLGYYSRGRRLLEGAQKVRGHCRKSAWLTIVDFNNHYAVNVVILVCC